MFLNLRVYTSLFIFTVVCNTNCYLAPFLVPVGTQTSLGTYVFSADWCTCKLLAAGGQNVTNGIIGIYEFNQTTGNLAPIGIPTTLGFIINSVKWCPLCTFLAAGGRDLDYSAIIQIYSFDPDNPGNLELVGSKTTLGSNMAVTSLDWCPSCSYLAASIGYGHFGSTGKIEIFSFNPEIGLSAVVTQTSFNRYSVDAIKWCDCHYLAAITSLAGASYPPSTLSIFSFDSNTGDLALTFSIDTNVHYNSIDWGNGNDCSYIAACGQGGMASGIIDIYYFDTESLSLVNSTTTLPDGNFNSVAWCQEYDYLTVAGFINDDQILQLYNFDSSTGGLSLLQTYTLNFFSHIIDWCDNCCNLAVGGSDLFNEIGTIQIFKGNTCITSPANLTAQKIYHRFPTQVDIINKLCWDAVPNAVEYDVYSDVNLSILLATIATTPYCYSQHQISPGKSATYYVTAVDAQGNQSEPAVVTI